MGIGLLSSLLSFSIPLSFALALCLLLLEQFIERIVFTYAIMYVQPMPDFTYDPREWAGMGYAFPRDQSDEKKLNVVGPAFRTEEFAEKFFGLLRTWNYNDEVDQEDNVCVSFIIEEDSEYTVYIYPNKDRPSAKSFWEEIEKKLNASEQTRKYDRLLIQFKFVHSFPLHEGSSLFNMFRETQQAERPFWFQPFLFKEDGQIEMLHIKPILKFHWTIKERSEVTPGEIEFRSGPLAEGFARISQGFLE